MNRVFLLCLLLVHSAMFAAETTAPRPIELKPVTITIADEPETWLSYSAEVFGRSRMLEKAKNCYTGNISAGTWILLGRGVPQYAIPWNGDPNLYVKCTSTQLLTSNSPNGPWKIEGIDATTPYGGTEAIEHAAAQGLHVSCIVIDGHASPATLKLLETLAPTAISIEGERVADAIPAPQSIKFAKLSVRFSRDTTAKVIAKFSNLEVLDLGKFENVSNLDVLKGLPKLRELALPHMQDLTTALDEGVMAQLTPLLNVSMKNCNPLRSAQNLEVLHADFEALTGLGQLKNLRALELGAAQLSSLEGIQGLTNLTELTFYWQNDNDVDLGPLADLANLRSLQFVNDCNVATLAPLRNLLKLEDMSLKSKTLVNVNGVENLSSLRTLNLNGCTGLKDIAAIRSLKHMEKLSLVYCSAISDITPIQDLKHLTQLGLPQLTDSKELQELRNSGSLDTIERFSVDSNERLTNVDALRGLKQLRSVNFFICKKLENIDGLEGTTGLEEFGVKNSPLKTLRGLRNHNNLRTIWISSCEQLNDISGISDAARLEELFIGECQALTDISALKNLRNLERLKFFNCNKLPNLKGCEGLGNLKRLELWITKGLADIGAVERLSKLSYLLIRDSAVLDNLDALKHLDALRNLEISECPMIADVSPLQSLAYLEELGIYECAGISSLKPLYGLKHLQWLRLSLDTLPHQEIEGVKKALPHCNVR